MKRMLLGLIVGLVLGAVGARVYLSPPGKAKAEAAKPEEKPKENPLHIPADKRTAAGIVLAKPRETTLAPEVTAFGRVLDPAPLVALLGEQATARAALAAAEKELQRAQKLFSAGGNASAQTVEAAEAAVLRERAAQATIAARLLATWGPELAGVADLKFVTAALEQGRSLLRLDVLPGDKTMERPKTARVMAPGGNDAVEVEVLGAAPAADPQIQGLSFLALTRDRAWPAGTSVRATLPAPGESQAALIVPRSAIVYHQGSAWIYVLGEEDTFERKLVTTGRTLGNDIALLAGAEADEQIVTTGAQQILAAELQAGGAPEEG